jgi:hypothetical protein
MRRTTGMGSEAEVEWAASILALQLRLAAEVSSTRRDLVGPSP